MSRRLTFLLAPLLFLAAACDDEPGQDPSRAAATPGLAAPTATSTSAQTSTTAARATPAASVTRTSVMGRPPPVSGRPPPPSQQPTNTPDIGPDGVPRVPPLERLTFSDGSRLTLEDLAQRRSGTAGRGTFNIARIVIPSISVDAAVEVQKVGLDGRMPEPSSAAVVAWYDFSEWPGFGGLPLSGGNAVFAGDLDRTRVGPGVFFRLAEVRPGEIIAIELTDGRRLYYHVEFNKLTARDGDFADVTIATAAESATFITAAGAFGPSGYPDRRIVWARRVNCQPGGVGCDLPE